jgi:hypothetical protein
MWDGVSVTPLEKAYDEKEFEAEYRENNGQSHAIDA